MWEDNLSLLLKNRPNTSTKKYINLIVLGKTAFQSMLMHERESECEREELRHWEKPRCIQVHNVKHSANTNTIQSKRV